MRIEPAEGTHAEQIAAMCAEEGWTAWAEPERALSALTAPAASAVVALEGGGVVGAAQMISDGSIASYMSMLLVRESHRGGGVGRELVAALFSRSGMARIDLLAEPDAAGFYRRLQHRELIGFRLYPEAP
jgi:ribosomal protein S18 acetylase RimI-like enzyme